MSDLSVDFVGLNRPSGPWLGPGRIVSSKIHELSAGCWSETRRLGVVMKSLLQIQESASAGVSSVSDEFFEELEDDLLARSFLYDNQAAYREGVEATMAAVRAGLAHAGSTCAGA